jgi:Divergent InlB B-repeat domain/Trypsin-like peptidase domain
LIEKSLSGARQQPSHFVGNLLIAGAVALALAACGGGAPPPAEPSKTAAEASTTAADPLQDIQRVAGAYTPPPVGHFQPEPSQVSEDTTQRLRSALAKSAFVAHFTAAQSGQEVARNIESARNGSADNQRRAGDERHAPRRIAFGRDLIGAKSSADVQARMLWRAASSGLSSEIGVSVPGAVGARLGLVIERLPDNAMLRVFAPDGSIEHVFTGAQIKAQLQSLRSPIKGVLGQFWTPYVSGGQIVLAIDLPAGSSAADVRLSVPRVSHFEPPAANVVDAKPADAIEARIGESGSCNLDANCFTDTTAENNAVARMVITDETGGSGLCTGTLLNDRGTTGTPYFITANHCISKQSEAAGLQTFWFYRSTSCGSGQLSGSSVSRSGGAQLLYNSSNTDVAFLRLNATPPPGAIYVGWTVSVPTVGQAVVGVHHPRGDLLKVSFGAVREYRRCTVVSPNSTSLACVAEPAGTSQFVEARFTNGTTEGGSSGSALFVTEGGAKRFVGQLYGGSSSCSFRDGSNIYGRFDISYNQGISTYLESTSPPMVFPLQVRRAGTGSGTVNSSPVGISCGSACVQNFAANTVVLLTAAPTSGSSFAGWTGACSGVDNCIVTMSAARDVTANFNAPNTSLATALDNPSLNVATSGAQPFFAQAQQFLVGGFAAQSGSVGDGQLSAMSMSFTGPGRVSFAWKTSSELDYDFERFYVNGVQRAELSGLSQWITQTFDIGAGVQNVRWAYEKDGSLVGGLDAAWVDNVQFTATSGDPNPPPTGSSVVVNGGFEDGTGWTSTPGNLLFTRPSIIPAAPNGGNRVAWLCGVNNCNERLAQTFAVPTNASGLTIDFDAYILTEEGPGTAFDRVNVEIISVTNPAQRTVIVALSNLDAASAWQHFTREVSGFAGQTVEVRFSGSADGSLLTDFFIDNLRIVVRSAAPAPVLPNSGWYWNASEGGRGWAIERAGDRIFVAGFMYETNGAAVWYVSTLNRQTDGSYTGVMSRYDGGQSLFGSWRAPASNAFASLRLRFSTANTARLEVLSLAQGGAPVFVIETNDLTRFPISTPTAFAAPQSLGQTGWWWNEAEPGRGYFVEVQGTQAFVAYFGYTTGGPPVWFASRMNSVGTSFDTLASASMDEFANGQVLGGNYRTPVVSGSAGQWSVRFTSASTGIVTLPNGAQIPIKRFLF